jgi:hypothetical protein
MVLKQDGGYRDLGRGYWLAKTYIILESILYLFIVLFFGGILVLNYF